MKIKGLLTTTLLVPFLVTLSYADEQTAAPSAEIAIAPETSAQAAAPALPPKLVPLDADRNGKISRDELVSCVTKKAKEKITEKAKKLDTDGDKYLSKEELQGKNKLNARFDDIDTDKDGKLSREETLAFVQKRADERAAKLFLNLDSNKDGSITVDEIKKKTTNTIEETTAEDDL